VNTSAAAPEIKSMRSKNMRKRELKICFINKICA
jgi:hypothetical protein